MENYSVFQNNQVTIANLYEEGTVKYYYKCSTCEKTKGKSPLSKGSLKEFLAFIALHKGAEGHNTKMFYVINKGGLIGNFGE